MLASWKMCDYMYVATGPFVDENSKTIAQIPSDFETILTRFNGIDVTYGAHSCNTNPLTTSKSRHRNIFGFSAIQSVLLFCSIMRIKLLLLNQFYSTLVYYM